MELTTKWTIAEAVAVAIARECQLTSGLIGYEALWDSDKGKTWTDRVWGVYRKPHHYPDPPVVGGFLEGDEAKRLAQQMNQEFSQELSQYLSQEECK